MGLCATRPVPPDSRVSPEACTTMYSLSLVAPGAGPFSPLLESLNKIHNSVPDLACVFCPIC